MISNQANYYYILYLIQDVILEIGDVETDNFAFPLVPVEIIDCGVMSVEEAFKLDNPDDAEKKRIAERKKAKKTKKNYILTQRSMLNFCFNHLHHSYNHSRIVQSSTVCLLNS